MSLFSLFKKKRKRKNLQKNAINPSKKPKQDEMLQQADSMVDAVQKILGQNDDFVTRNILIFGTYKAHLFYFADFADEKQIHDEVLKPIMHLPQQLKQKIDKQNLIQTLVTSTFSHSGLQGEKDIHLIIDALLAGKATILIEGIHEGILFDVQKFNHRSVDQPKTEQVIRGPRDGFIEPLGVNLGLLRYRLPTPDFRVKTMKIGKLTKTKVAVCYIDGVVNPALVEEVNRRLSNIDIDAILDSGYIEQFITDNHITPFPLIQNTERPDKVVASLLEGRVAILVDGTPFALIAPTVFNQFYQSVDDYSERALIASCIRFIRLVALIFSLIFPSIYVSVISFNPELIPTEFAVAVAGGRAGIPFPAVVEVLVIEISMEVLREATIRLPQQVGGALSIVGVLVVGQAAVSAGFASPITVVVIALTTIGSFATPAYNAALALRLLRFPLVFLAGVFGLYGVMVGLILITNHLLSLRSFGVPYISPLVPGNFQAMKDTLVRSPLWMMPKRPSMFRTLNRDRLGPDTKKQVNREQHNSLTPIGASVEKENTTNAKPSSDNGDRGGMHPDQHD